MINRRRLASYLDSETLSESVKKEIRRLLKNNKVVLPGWSPTFLTRLGDIRTVIDVGVLDGTPELYQAFPEAYLVLVEALPSYENKCNALLEGRSGEVHMCAAGSEDGTTTIRHYQDRPRVSSMLEASSSKGLAYTELTVPLRRLDSMLKNTELSADVLLKIDVEGMELEVLKGAKETLKRVKYIIAETSIRKRHEGSYRFADLIAFLAAEDFQLFDALRVTRPRAMHPKASIMDAIFVREA